MSWVPERRLERERRERDAAYFDRLAAEARLVDRRGCAGRHHCTIVASGIAGDVNDYP